MVGIHFRTCIITHAIHAIGDGLDNIEKKKFATISIGFGTRQPNENTIKPKKSVLNN